MSGTHFPLPSKSSPLLLMPVMHGLMARWSAAKALPGHSPKKKVARLAACMVSPFLWPKTPMQPMLVSLPDRAQRLLDRLKSEGVLPGTGAAIMLNSPVPGRSRIYLRHLDKCGRVVGYSKVGYGPGDEARFSREASALSIFASVPDFSVPRVISRGQQPDIGEYLVLEPLDRKFGNVPSRSDNLLALVKSGLSGVAVPCSRQQLCERWWYQEGVAKLSADQRNWLAKLIAQPNPMLVCRAHGDVGGENVYSAIDGSIAIIDWESFDEMAPVLVDDISLWIGRHHAILRNAQQKGARSFVAHFATDDDVALALVFLIAAGINEASVLLSTVYQTRLEIE